jgi:hypothetical protein
MPASSVDASCARSLVRLCYAPHVLRRRGRAGARRRGRAHDLHLAEVTWPSWWRLVLAVVAGMYMVAALSSRRICVSRKMGKNRIASSKGNR